MSPIFIDSFMIGWFKMKSPTGKQVIFFEDSEQFGPSQIHLRTEEPSPIPDKSWFWKVYPEWVKRGRPVTGQTLPSRYSGEFQICDTKALGDSK